MHRCCLCDEACNCGGDIEPGIREEERPGCSHCAACCDHGFSFDVPCELCEEELNCVENQIDAADEGLDPQRPYPVSLNGGW